MRAFLFTKSIDLKTGDALYARRLVSPLIKGAGAQQKSYAAGRALGTKHTQHAASATR
jgi:hypothetical protein